MPRLVGILPHSEVAIPKALKQYKGQLADPLWNVPAGIDVLLGADVYHSIVVGGPLDLGSVTLISTIFGYAISGPILRRPTTYSVTFSAPSIDCAFDLERFWCIEEISENLEKSLSDKASYRVPYRSEEEKFAEDHFLANYTLDSEGRYVTSLPFKGAVTSLGNSERVAYVQFLNLEKKLETLPCTYVKYRDFMQELLDLKHMEVVPECELVTDAWKSYYIPHHCVVKEDSTTTKLRVVFNASTKTSSGVSLNELLAVGPKLQDDLFHILVRFRCNKIAICGDVAKMYRQIRLDDEGKDYHRLLWRDDRSGPIKVFRMTRVMYGVGSAGYSSVKALQMTGAKYLEKLKIAENGHVSTTLSAGLERSMMDFYVDDMLSGSDSIASSRLLIKQICQCLATGGFELRKMASSEPELVNELPEKLRENVDAFILGDVDHTIKTLGVIWYPVHDTFGFKVSHLDSDPEPVKSKKRKRKASYKAKKSEIPEGEEIFGTSTTVSAFTKRQILSDIAKIFDPLGFLCPSTIRLKICMQDIWKSQKDWDDLLPESLTIPYLDWRSGLVLLRNCSIPRKVLSCFDEYSVQNTELHVFCDASTKAYGAVVYLRQEVGNTVSCKMLTSKCKVAPLKQLTVPKLELQAALLGANLVKAVRHALRNSSMKLKCFAWSDSTTVLHWLSCLPGRWQTFVSNRVAQIQELIPFEDWRHVPTEVNPADLASRGMGVQELLDSVLWWTGPDFLNDLPLRFPAQPQDFDLSEVSAEEKVVAESFASLSTTVCKPGVLVGDVSCPSVLNLMNVVWFSSLDQLLVRLAIVKRFIDTALKRPLKVGHGEILLKSGKNFAVVSTEERRAALRLLTIATQDYYFKVEKGIVQRGEQIPKSNKLCKLFPFIDTDDLVMRVGGRLQGLDGMVSQLTMYPAILPKGSELSRLLAIQVHNQTLHGGLMLCIGTLRRSFWVISSRQLFKSLLRNCVKCFRHNSKPIHALMGDLPKERVTPSRPFAYTGLDFAGPLYIKALAGPEKVYLAIFVCFATKAAHIEVVSKLTTCACIAAVHRFVARRGVPIRMYSDNGSNLKGAREDLAKIRQVLEPKGGAVAEEVERLGMEWVFIPPGSPNFGGLWEAAVKSAKAHLKKVVGRQTLTFEELVTLCCDIESMMNSRPLMPLSEDVNDLVALTPFMLLTGFPAGRLPMLPLRRLKSEELEHLEPKRRWAHVTNMAADFWKRWQVEYVTSLQQRPKNAVEKPNLEVGDLVLLTHEHTAPLDWPLGRIMQVFPGNDGQVRTVLIKTQKGTYQRPAYKARKLPVERTDKVVKVEELKSTEKELDPQEVCETKRRSARLIRKRELVGLEQDLSQE